MTDERQIFTLKQVALSIRKVIAERYSQTYWVQAEMHKLNLTSKGHCYPELVYKENGTIVAEMRGTIWQQVFDRVSKQFADVVKEPLRDGLELLLLVRINFHPLYGMGLEILDIDPSYSLGALQRERDETLRRLRQEGLLNRNQLLSFPLLPKRVAVISQESSKGLSDFYSVTLNNDWNYQFFFMLFPAQLNGDAAVESICRQLDRVARVKDHFDVVLIIRGGGGEVGMHCYNHYDLAQKIASFPLPVLTGIGHSTNITVSEMVAWRNAITPTALGEFLIQSFHNFALPLQDFTQQLHRAFNKLMDQEKMALRNELRFVGKVSENYLLKERNKLAATGRELRAEVRNQMNKQKNGLQRHVEHLRLMSISLFKREKTLLREHEMDLKKGTPQFVVEAVGKQSDLETRMKTGLKEVIQKQDVLLRDLQRAIKLVDPQAVLKRGFSITLKNGKAVVSAHELKLGDEIITQLAVGQMSSTVSKTQTDE